MREKNSEKSVHLTLQGWINLITPQMPQQEMQHVHYSKEVNSIEHGMYNFDLGNSEIYSGSPSPSSVFFFLLTYNGPRMVTYGQDKRLYNLPSRQKHTDYYVMYFQKHTYLYKLR